MEQQPAVLDRIEDGEFALLLLGDAQQVWVVQVERLPAGASPGAWFEVGNEDDTLRWIEMDSGATDQAKARAGPAAVAGPSS